MWRQCDNNCKTTMIWLSWALNITIYDNIDILPIPIPQACSRAWTLYSPISRKLFLTNWMDIIMWYLFTKLHSTFAGDNSNNYRHVLRPFLPTCKGSSGKTAFKWQKVKTMSWLPNKCMWSLLQVYTTFQSISNQLQWRLLVIVIMSYCTTINTNNIMLALWSVPYTV